MMINTWNLHVQNFRGQNAVSKFLQMMLYEVDYCRNRILLSVLRHNGVPWEARALAYY